MKRLIIGVTFFLAISFIIASAAFAQPIKVTVSIFPVGDMVKEVGGDRVAVQVLLPPGASPHVFEATPGMAKEVSESKLFFEVGAGLDFWAEKLVKAVRPNIRVVVLSNGMKLLKEEGEHGYEHGAGNPHVWLDPVLVVEMVKKIQKVLVETDPGGAEIYRKRGAAYIEKLKILDGEISKTIATFAIKSFVSFHPAWDYFALRYGLKDAGVIEESPGQEPAPRALEGIVRAIRHYHIRAVFAEPQLNPKVAEVIAREAGVRVVMLDPIGGLAGRKTYVELMRYNLRQMKDAMQ
jgi:ABC-type Zn uptake system ZnuABC Zn-binding protein ZnuA